jgi:hypothetical protein
MPHPLPEALTAVLQLDRTAALFDDPQIADELFFRASPPARRRPAESAQGKWRLVASEAPRTPRWVEPVSAVGRREHASA